ncbi:hypothetical protein PC119_g2970 [Phytophthora cactorum]|uniref:EF-hand domain-containing protein n=1 Tax=Phytophthora cactorum TaxID=29920 RepID=A0A8T1DJC8_9STRA|nr:hypothetical protein PC113_g1420 [Phytophthora cactorum]KAG2939803.1 hypothetical protein PC115_g2902 [Phytophthora cactorum]KAG3038355.1 hypothetical protein PC119_g2970 [Phytophthora cactorum]KAG3100787.1 hypothetical protein PC122_g2992 [Phytophthora cactorum]
MDKDKSGEINMLEFFDYIDLKRSRFSEKAFSVMDRNGSGEVDFIEFVLAVWNYCSFNHASLVRFAFDLYDVDGSGEIEHDEVVRCVREVWGSSWETSPNAHKIVEKLDTIMENTVSNRLSANLFQEFAVRHPMLLFPAFELQMEIQRKVLGKRFWSRAAEKRGSINVAALNWDHVKELNPHQTGTAEVQAFDHFLIDQDAHLSPAQTTKVPILLVVAMTFQMME